MVFHNSYTITFTLPFTFIYYVHIHTYARVSASLIWSFALIWQDLWFVHTGVEVDKVAIDFLSPAGRLFIDGDIFGSG